MKNISIGDLRHRITFQECQKTPDGHGGFDVAGWSDVVTVWAGIEPISGREYFYAQQIKAEVTHKVRIRYRTGITEEMRIKYGERILEIEAVRDLNEQHKVIEIFCREGKKSEG